MIGSIANWPLCAVPITAREAASQHKPRLRRVRYGLASWFGSKTNAWDCDGWHGETALVAYRAWEKHGRMSEREWMLSMPMASGGCCPCAGHTGSLASLDVGTPQLQVRE